MRASDNGESGYRRGYALILLLIMGVAVWLILQLTIMGGFRFSSSEPDPNLPWNQGFEFVESPERCGRPRAKQVDLSEKIHYKVQVQKGKSGMGTLVIVVGDDGMVSGVWEGSFWGEEKKQYDVINGGTVGNIDPERLYTDKAGRERPERLYFLTRGQYMVLETDHEANKVRKKGGMLHVEGWIEPDKRVFGKFYMEGRGGEHKVFTWRGKPMKTRNFRGH